MSKLRVHNFAISLDGYGAGPKQDLDDPLGVGGEALHDWFIATRTFHRTYGKEGGTTGVDDDLAARGFAEVGAFIMGRNMFGSVRGPWPDDEWKGWWGVNPPYHAPVFVLTNHPRAPVVMEGGTIFHFMTEGIHAALQNANEAADGKDVQLMGGCHDPGISWRCADRRDAFRHFPDPAWLGGKSFRWNRCPETRLSPRRTRDDRERDACCSQKAGLSPASPLNP